MIPASSRMMAREWYAHFPSTRSAQASKACTLAFCLTESSGLIRASSRPENPSSRFRRNTRVSGVPCYQTHVLTADVQDWELCRSSCKIVSLTYQLAPTPEHIKQYSWQDLPYILFDLPTPTDESESSLCALSKAICARAERKTITCPQWTIQTWGPSL